MPSTQPLIAILLEMRRLLDDAQNDFTWSGWPDHTVALQEVDALLERLRAGQVPELMLDVLFAPTGPVQEVGVSSGWGDAFNQLADRYDAVMAARGDDDSEPIETCHCESAPPANLSAAHDLGMDRVFGEVSVAICRDCGRHWLRYLYENEAVSRSGRWYLGAITPEQRAAVSADNARALLESLAAYYYGGSYFEGRTGKSSGPIRLTP